MDQQRNSVAGSVKKRKFSLSTTLKDMNLKNLIHTKNFKIFIIGHRIGDIAFSSVEVSIQNLTLKHFEQEKLLL